MKTFYRQITIYSINSNHFFKELRIMKTVSYNLVLVNTLTKKEYVYNGFTSYGNCIKQINSFIGNLFKGKSIKKSENMFNSLFTYTIKQIID